MGATVRNSLEECNRKGETEIVMHIIGEILGIPRSSKLGCVMCSVLRLLVCNGERW